MTTMEQERITIRVRAIEIEITTERIGPKRVEPELVIEESRDVSLPAKIEAA